MLENHGGRVAGFKRDFRHVIGFSDAVGNEAMPERVFLQFNGRERGAVAFGFDFSGGGGGAVQFVKHETFLREHLAGFLRG